MDGAKVAPGAGWASGALVKGQCPDSLLGSESFQKQGALTSPVGALGWPQGLESTGWACCRTYRGQNTVLPLWPGLDAQLLAKGLLLPSPPMWLSTIGAAGAWSHFLALAGGEISDLPQG